MGISFVCVVNIDWLNAKFAIGTKEWLKVQYLVVRYPIENLHDLHEFWI